MAKRLDFVEEVGLDEGMLEGLDVDVDGSWDETSMEEGELEVNSHGSFSSINVIA